MEPIGLLEKPPDSVVVGSCAERDAPLGHGVVRVVGDDLTIALDSFIMVEAVSQDVGSVNPNLGFLPIGAYREM